MKHKKDGTFAKLTTADIQQRVERCGDFSYLGGYTGSEGYVDLKCNVCGSEFSHSFVGIRHGKRITCKTCMENRKTQRDAERRAARKAERVAAREARAKANAEAKAEAKAKTLRAKGREVICKRCGRVFVTTNSRAITCSSECSRAYRNNRKDKRLEGIPKDNSISLARLITRDCNRCYLCGELCDSDDYSYNDDGVFVVGSMYPSIDHIVPIAKGGTHQWDNIALAHKLCNTNKRDNILRTAPGQKRFDNPKGTEGRGHKKLRKGAERGGVNGKTIKKGEGKE